MGPALTAPTIEEAPGPVVLFSPAWSPHPVFHRLGYHFAEDVSQAHRERLGVPEGFSVTVVATPCGAIVRATWWLEPPDHRTPEFAASYEHPFTAVELRLAQAAAFGRPCRRCFTVPSDPA